MTDYISVFFSVASTVIVLICLRYIVVLGRDKGEPAVEGEDVVGTLQSILGVYVREMAAHFEDSSKKLAEHLKRSFTAIITARQGKLGEMEALFALKERYVRLIPLGQPIDFIGVASDTIDFIEIKTGRARLTKEERLIKDLVDSGKVQFRLMREDDYR